MFVNRNTHRPYHLRRKFVVFETENSVTQKRKHMIVIFRLFFGGLNVKIFRVLFIINIVCLVFQLYWYNKDFYWYDKDFSKIILPHFSKL